jgi:hypothetical protein
LDWINQSNPDILCLQETKVMDESFPVEPFEKLEIDSSTKTEHDSSVLPTNPFELVEMIRRQNSMNDATDPSDAIDDALRSFNSLEENLEI